MNKEAKGSNECPICGRPTHKESKHCIFHAGVEEKTEEEFKMALKEYIDRIKDENKDYNFEGFIFVGYVIDFKKEFGVDVFVHVNFKGTFFKGFAKFEGIVFQGDANFDNSKFDGASFKNTRFEGDLFLTNATFNSVVTFEQAFFLKHAYFGETIFFEQATFNSMTVAAANFFKTTFKKYALFMKTNFKKEVLFWYARFESIAYFNEANFPSHVNFTETSFKIVIFEKAIFKNGAIFSNTTFNGVANFEETNFSGNIFFNETTFRGITKFILIGKQINLDFTYSKFNSGIFVIIEIRKGEINFKNALLENVSLNFKIERDVLVNYERAVLKNTQLKRKDIEFNIMQERKNKFSEAKEIYLTLKNNFHSTGRYDDESWAFKKEKDMERLSYSFYSFKKDLVKKKKKEIFPILKWMCTKDFKKWTTSAFSNIIYGYGEKPWNVIKTAVAIILIFALSFSFIGLGNPEIIELKGTAIHQNSGNTVDLASKGLLKNNVIRNFPDSLYFSTITFTTLGYGDFRPLEGLGRILAGSEAFLGAIMMALFVYTFARRTGGR